MRSPVSPGGSGGASRRRNERREKRRKKEKNKKIKIKNLKVGAYKGAETFLKCLRPLLFEKWETRERNFQKCRSP